MALVSACAFTGIYAFRVAEEARQLATALNATEMVLAREQHLSALDGLAAAAAHELGTPLATIALVARELEREMAGDKRHAEDIALLNSQAQRCRDILAKLTSLSSELDQAHRPPAAVASHRGGGRALSRLRHRDRHRCRRAATAPSRSAAAIPAIIQALANLVENAVDFAASRVEIATEWNAREVAVTIADDGPRLHARRSSAGSASLM